MFVLGITGGIASGKTHATNVLKGLGALIWDADEASRRVVEPGRDGNYALRRVFGDKFFNNDGTLKRRQLAEYVFEDPDRLMQLNSCMHPAIADDMHQQLERWEKQGEKLVVVSAPLLFEAGLDVYMDEIWTLSCGKDEQIRRLMLRDNLNYAQAETRVDAQLSDAHRRAQADRVIDTISPEEDTARLLTALYEEKLEELA